MSVVTLWVQRPYARRKLTSYQVLGILIVVGFLGSLYGRVLDGNTANSLALFAPAIIVAVDSVSRWSFDTSRVFVAFKAAGVVYAVCVIAVLGFGFGLAEAEHFRHESAYFLALGIAGAFVTRDVITGVLMVVAGWLCFDAYPALTYVFVAIVVACVLSLHYLNRRLARVLAAIYVVVGLLAFAFRRMILAASSSYYGDVGKGDNTQTREVLYRMGRARVAESPWFGSLFRDNIAVRPPDGLTGEFKLVPLHDDYLQLAVGGGWVFSILFVGAVLVVAARAMLWSMELSPRDPRRMTVTVCCSGLLAMLVTAMFNPVLFVAYNGLIFGLLLITIRNLPPGQFFGVSSEIV
ncbi:O-antigen ligase family protein [Gordonia rhizosphera]|nr:O-antigen ligase family protein [Gordonia rhizosphera]